MASDEQFVELVRDAPRAVLGTIDAEGRSHLVPIVFAVLADGRIVTAVDDKPKTTRDLKRLRNIARDPRVTVLVDEYDEDWSRLWWVRVSGEATVTEDSPAGALDALVGKYDAYRDAPPAGPWITIRTIEIVVWSAR